MYVRLATAIIYRMHYTGCENIPKEGGVLLAANHQSHLDPPLIAAGSSRRMNFLAQEPVPLHAIRLDHPFARRDPTRPGGIADARHS